MKYLTPFTALFFWFTASSQQKTVAVFFETNSYQVDNRSARQLDSISTGLAGISIGLKGYCDSRGADQYNLVLSEQRVKAVKQYLLAKGIHPSQIVTETGYGESMPLNENKNPREMQMNRRVDILFHSTGTPTEPGTDTSTLKEKIANSTITVGSNLVLKHINFQPGLARFLPGALPMLQQLLDVMVSYRSLVIEVQGHICCDLGVADGLDNETGIRNLSHTRAEAVRDFLVGNGIAPERVFYKGYAHTRPIYPSPEKSEEERVANRRVEIRILQK